MCGTAVISQNAALVTGPTANTRREMAPVRPSGAQSAATSSPKRSGSGRAVPSASWAEMAQEAQLVGHAHGLPNVQ